MLDINNLGKEEEEDEDDYSQDESDKEKAKDDEQTESQRRGLARQTDKNNLEESNQLGKLQEENEDDDDKYGQDINDFEESPRPKGPSNGVARQLDDTEQKMDVAEEDRIEIAEKVLILIVKQMNVKGYRSIKELVQEHVYESMIEGQIFELLLPENFIECLKQIDVDLGETEQLCLLEVLAKQQLENVIMMEELEGIMMNVQDVIDNGEDVSES